MKRVLTIDEVKVFLNGLKLRPKTEYQAVEMYKALMKAKGFCPRAKPTKARYDCPARTLVNGHVHAHKHTKRRQPTRNWRYSTVENW